MRSLSRWIQLLHCFDKLFDLRLRCLEGPPAVEIRRPDGSLSKRARGVLVHSLGHQGNQVAHHTSVIEK